MKNFFTNLFTKLFSKPKSEAAIEIVTKCKCGCDKAGCKCDENCNCENCGCDCNKDCSCKKKKKATKAKTKKKE